MFTSAAKYLKRETERQRETDREMKREGRDRR